MSNVCKVKLKNAFSFILIALSINLLTFAAGALEGEITVGGRQYTIIREIARGGEGSVYEVQDSAKPELRYALKVQNISTINPYDPVNPSHQEEFSQREFAFDFYKNRVKNLPTQLKKILKYLPLVFDHIIHLPEQDNRDSSKPDILIRSGVSLMTLADDTLYSHILKLNQNLSLTTEQQQQARSELALTVFKNILEQLKALSDHSYSYLDLKPFNIGYDSASNTYSLLDLNSIYSTIHGEDTRRNIFVTYFFTAPEIFQADKYSEVSQLYSLAMTLLEILDMKFEYHFRYKLFNKNDTHFDQHELLRLERSYLLSVADIDRSRLTKVFSFLKAASEKDPYIRSQKLRELTFSPEIKSIVEKADVKQSRVSALMESLKAKLKNTQQGQKTKISCDGIFH